MRELSRAEIDEVLTRNGIGVLALTGETGPYPIPMSFGYDGDRPTFVLQFGRTDESLKVACLDDSSQVGFTVYEETVADEQWRSVVVTGVLAPVAERREDEAFAALAANADFPPDTSVWGEPLSATDLSLYELDIEEATGREFSMATS